MLEQAWSEVILISNFFGSNVNPFVSIYNFLGSNVNLFGSRWLRVVFFTKIRKTFQEMPLNFAGEHQWVVYNEVILNKTAAY